MDFALNQYTVMESMGHVEIELILTGATSDSPFTVTVVSSERTLTSAMGEFCNDIYIYICVYTDVHT